MKLTKDTITQIENVAQAGDLDILAKVRGILCAIDFNDNVVEDGLLDQNQKALLNEWTEGFEQGKEIWS